MIGCHSDVLILRGADEWIVLLLPMFRAKYVERCKQRAFDYLNRGDLKGAVSSFAKNMEARPDCELPRHLAELGVVLWMNKDVQGWKALIEEIK